jgi:hypothetical protein
VLERRGEKERESGSEREECVCLRIQSALVKVLIASDLAGVKSPIWCGTAVGKGWMGGTDFEPAVGGGASRGRVCRMACRDRWRAGQVPHDVPSTR